MSDGQLAGAASAGAGSGQMGGACDMAARVQEALRRDPLVHASIGGFAGKAIKVWDGDWVWMPGDIGQGLTAVRQAMEWEIAYSPKACRAAPMHGLVVFSLVEPRGSVRLVVGQNDWRWSDMAIARSTVQGSALSKP
ncbi:MAG: hypothetical protein P4L64_13630 [Caulobacteraceae bacterium]|nr:hypothetical protein [Caulobacteraceae bacterium]